jgi:pimeloyl-ACP methyl ester carboxylesterase
MLVCFEQNERFRFSTATDKLVEGVVHAPLLFIGSTPHDLRLLRQSIRNCLADGVSGMDGIQQQLKAWVRSQRGQRIGSDAGVPMTYGIDPPTATQYGLPSLIDDEPYAELLAALEIAEESLAFDEGQSRFAPAASLSFLFAIDAAADRRRRRRLHYASFHDAQDMLVMSQGSLLAALATAAETFSAVRRFSSWALGLVTSTSAALLSRKRAGEWFVENLRSKAPSLHGMSPLPRLDEIWLDRSNGGDKKQAIIVALHGLFSTDAGTFDGFRAALRSHLRNLSGASADELFDEHYDMVGWPHDTLLKIGDNAAMLARLIDQRVANGPDIIFISHSRGGLVARATAARLLQSKVWRKRIKGILSFGTPHDGAELAESSVFQQIVAYLMLGASTSWRSALPYYLAYLGHLERQGRAGHIDGIRDLAPVGNGYSTFLSDLMDAEAKLGKSRPPIFAVGGDAARNPASLSTMAQKAMHHMKKLIDGHIGHAANDIVVRLDSSAPAWIAKSRRSTVACDHFNYFESSAASDYAAPLRMLLDWMAWKQIVQAGAAGRSHAA